MGQTHLSRSAYSGNILFFFFDTLTVTRINSTYSYYWLPILCQAPAQGEKETQRETESCAQVSWVQLLAALSLHPCGGCGHAGRADSPVPLPPQSVLAAWPPWFHRGFVAHGKRLPQAGIKCETWLEVEGWDLMHQRVLLLGVGRERIEEEPGKELVQSKGSEVQGTGSYSAGLESGREGQEVLWWALRLRRNTGCLFQRAAPLG